MRVAWWRVGILAAVTVAAGTGAWIEFTQAGRTPVASRSSALPTPRGPNPGDLRALFAASPASPSPSPAPTPVPVVAAAPRRSTATDRRASGSPRTSSAGGNPFHGIPGAGPIEDLCRTGCGR